jgi:flagellar hook-length control protein FliK
MPVSVSVISIAAPVSSATPSAAAHGLGSGGAAGPDPAPAGRIAAPVGGRPSFSDALHGAHRDRPTGSHPSNPGQGAPTGTALPPTGNPLPGSPPWPVPSPLRPMFPGPVSGSNGPTGDPAVATIGSAGDPVTGRPSGAPGTVPNGAIPSAAAARIGHAANPLPNANFVVSDPRAPHDAASGVPASAADGAGSAGLAPSAGASAPAAGATPIPAGAAEIAARAQVAAALHAGDAAATVGAYADPVPATVRAVAPARPARSGGGDAAAPSAGASGTIPAGAGGAAPTGAIAKIVSTAHAVMPAHAPSGAAPAASSVANTDGSRIAAAALTSAPTPVASDRAAPPALGPIDLGSHAWPAALADRITWLADQNLNGASLQVNPPHLGPVDLRISVERGHASVWIGANDGAAYDALQAGATHLRELLGSHGFMQVNVDVSRQSYRDPGAARQSFVPPIERGPATPAASRTAMPARASVGVLDAYA